MGSVAIIVIRIVVQRGVIVNGITNGVVRAFFNLLDSLQDMVWTESDGRVVDGIYDKR